MSAGKSLTHVRAASLLSAMRQTECVTEWARPSLSGQQVNQPVDRTRPMLKYFDTFIIRKLGSEGSIYVMILRSYLPYQTHCRNQVSGIANDVIYYEETSRQEVNDVQSDACLLSDDSLRELF